MYTPSDLKTLLIDIFADGHVDPEERERLQAFRDKLSDEATLKVFREFIDEKWGEVMADGELSADEKRLMDRVMGELALQLSHLPPAAQTALKRD